MSGQTNDAAIYDRAKDRVVALIAITEELTEIFERENALLKDRRPSAISPLQNDKARLAAAYAQSIREIARDRQTVAGAPSPLMERLKEITQAFEGSAREQRALLEAARTASEGVTKAVAAEAANAARPATYGGAREATPASTPIAVNRNA
jgi:hypothetical protein